MTDETLSRLLQLARNGLYDREIARRLGVKPGTCFYHRKKNGLMRRRGQPHHTLYTIYGKDGQYLFEGNIKECATFLGVQETSVRECMSRFRAGMRTPVEIHAEDMKRSVERMT